MRACSDIFRKPPPPFPIPSHSLLTVGFGVLPCFAQPLRLPSFIWTRVLTSHQHPLDESFTLFYSAVVG